MQISQPAVGRVAVPRRGQATRRIAGKHRVLQGDRDCRPKSRIWSAYLLAAILRVLRRAL